MPSPNRKAPALRQGSRLFRRVSSLTGSSAQRGFKRLPVKGVPGKKNPALTKRCGVESQSMYWRALSRNSALS
jgi:hypothetical protein